MQKPALSRILETETVLFAQLANFAAVMSRTTDAQLNALRTLVAEQGEQLSQ
jgi:hypothetical protein